MFSLELGASSHHYSATRGVSMHLKFERRHLSIVAFPEITLPQMTIVVGLNGTGKSHLLQAIQNGSISNSVFRVPLDQPLDQNSLPIKLLAQGGQPLSFGDTYVSPAAGQQPIDLASAFIQFRNQALSPFRAELNDLCGGGLDSVFAEHDVWRSGVEEIASRLGRAEFVEQIADIFVRAEAELTRPRSHQARRTSTYPDEASVFAAAQRISQKFQIAMLQIEAEHLKLFTQWGHTDQFAVNLPLIFGSYRDAQLRNWMLQRADSENGSSFALSNDEFKEKFGPPPWDLINEALKLFSLPYKVTTPLLFEYGRVSVELKKIRNGDIVQFSNLSSGEKVLIQFAISTFQYDEFFISVRRPQVLLLDEMDASLHPEMVHRWLRAIQNGLVDGQGIFCALTTHSPTTVALAPESALFEMRDGELGLAKISKQDALNKLTYGVPTLSIDYSGQRQVFSESDTDAAIYQRIYSIVKSQIACEFELNFLSTGMRNKDGGEINSGCTVVANIVERMIAAGNRTVFGIVDWDGSAVSTDRIKVVAEGLRDGIENVLLDPLLICLLLLKERRAPDELNDIDRFSSADMLEISDLQRMVDAIQHKVITEIGDSKLVQVSYIGGAVSNVLDAYLVMDDHMLEDKLRATFPCLRKWSNRGALVMAVIDEVLTEHRCFCPSEIRTLFETIANASA